MDNESSVGASVYVTFVVSCRPLILMCLIFVIVFKAVRFGAFESLFF